MLLGSGVLAAEASALYVQLAEREELPAIAAWRRPDVFPNDHRLYLGHKGAEKLGDLGITLSPSETFDRNCFIGSSNTKRREIGMRYEIGLDNMLWGNDFPHAESTWPKSREFLDRIFSGVPEDDRRKITSENASVLFRFDRS